MKRRVLEGMKFVCSGVFTFIQEENMKPSFRRNLMAVAVASALGGGANLASAAAFGLIEQNASGMGNAYAGAAAVAEDASIIFFNPAGMSLLQGRQVVVAGHVISVSAKFQDQGSTTPPAFGPTTGGNGGEAGDTAVVPNFYFSMPFNDRVSFGVGVNVPFGLATEYDDDWVGRFQGIKSELTTINLNPSVSLKVNEAFSLGAGINYQQIDVELTNAVVLAPPVFGGLAEGRAKLEADGDAWGWNVGAIWQMTPMTRLGVAYRSELDYELEGQIGVSQASNGAAVPLASGPARADVTLPDSLSLSLAHQMNDRLQLLADATLTNWSSIQAIDIRDGNSGAVRDRLTLDFDDSWRYSIGANFKLNEEWILKGGIAYDETPVKGATSRTVRLPDNDRTWVSVGAQMKVKQSGRLDFGYSHLFIKDADIDHTRGQFTPGTTTVNPATVSNVQGTYEGSVDIFSIQYTHSF